MIYDISQPVFECEVYPGDRRPERRLLHDMEKGELYNLTELSMSVHCGTHVDAPRHFLRDGMGAEGIEPEKCFGPAFVTERRGEISAADARDMLSRAEEARGGAWRRLLIKGRGTVTVEAARVFADAGVWLIGSETQSVGPENAPMAVHKILLGAQVVLLEGIRLDAVGEGAYFLSCVPLNLKDSDGAPCRAVLADMPEWENNDYEGVRPVRNDRIREDKFCWESGDVVITKPVWNGKEVTPEEFKRLVAESVQKHKDEENNKR